MAQVLQAAAVEDGNNQTVPLLQSYTQVNAEQQNEQVRRSTGRLLRTTVVFALSVALLTLALGIATHPALKPGSGNRSNNDNDNGATDFAQHAATSIISCGSRSCYWAVQTQECTAVHTVDRTDGSLVWRRAPVSEAYSWSMRLAQSSALFTLTDSPALYSISLNSGKERWEWPQRQRVWWWRREVDLPAKASLVDPVPVQDMVLVRSNDPADRVYGVTAGNLTWEVDATAAAVDAELADPGTPLAVAFTSVGSAGTVYIAVNTVPPLPAPDTDPNADGGEGGSRRHSGSRRLSSTTSTGTNGSHQQAAAAAAPSEPTEGWVQAVSLRTGELLWLSGRMPLGVAAVVEGEGVLLVSSQPDVDGTGYLYGLHRSSGSVLWSRTCVHGPCRVEALTSRVALLTGSLTQRPLSLEGLEAFELTTGEVVWKGPRVRNQPLPDGGCTALALPRMDIYLACTCYTNGTTDPEAAVAAAAGGAPDGAPVDGKGRKGTGLCGYAFGADNGKVLMEVVLGEGDSVPGDAATYGLRPLVLADSVVFPGRTAVYAVRRVPQLPGDDDDDGPSASPLMWTYLLPRGLAMSGYDTLDMHVGTVLVRVAPAAADGPAPPPPVAAEEHVVAAGAAVAVHPRLAGALLGSSSSSASQQRQAPPASLASSSQVLASSNGSFPKPSRIIGLSSSTGLRQWQAAINASSGPLGQQPLPTEYRWGLLVLDSCSAAGSAGEEASCCLYALNVTSGKRAWQHCFSIDHVCAATEARDMATALLYALLALQVVVLVVGFGSSCIIRACRDWMQRGKPVYVGSSSSPAYIHPPAIVEVISHDDDSDG